MKTLLQFGAGKIGRSFIAQIFSRAGYRVIFVDIDPCVVKSINEEGMYRVIITGNDGYSEEYNVRNIAAIEISSTKKVIQAIQAAGIISISVGKKSLLKLARILARGIKNRYQERKDASVDIILAENVKGAADLLSGEIRKRIPEVPLESYVGFVETSIGKIVPVMTEEQIEEDPLAIYAEPYNQLILDASGFRAGIPDVPELDPRVNLKAYSDRKLYIQYLGHSVIAYQAHARYPELVYTWQALEKKDILNITRSTMRQSANILHHMYPEEFSMDQLDQHIEDLLKRFANRSLNDTIFLAGCNLTEKLGREDRLMAPVEKAMKLQLEHDLILEAWIRGCLFNAKDENGKNCPENRKFKDKFNDDPMKILRDHCNFDPLTDREIFLQIFDF
jgi:mannitol-1-phosphate 5-dehydrogenase